MSAAKIGVGKPKNLKPVHDKITDKGHLTWGGSAKSSVCRLVSSLLTAIMRMPLDGAMSCFALDPRSPAIGLIGGTLDTYMPYLETDTLMAGSASVADPTSSSITDGMRIIPSFSTKSELSRQFLQRFGVDHSLDSPNLVVACRRIGHQ